MKKHEYKIMSAYDVDEVILSDRGSRGWRLIKVTQPILDDMNDVARLYIMEREI